MPEDENDLENEGGNENPNLRHIREKAERTEKAEAAEASLRREVAFLRAGIDTDSKLGALFQRSYEGDVTDVDALVAEAKELGVPFKGQSAPVEEPQSEESNEPTGSDQRRELANNAPADSGEQEHPWVRAEAAFKDAQSSGARWEEAGGEAVRILAQAANAGDERAIVKRQRQIIVSE